MTINSKNTTYSYLDIVLIAILIGISLVYFLQFRFLSFDEGVFIWCGQNILNREIPYKDFFEIKPPVIFFTNALGIFLFGLKNYAFKWITFIFICLADVLFFISMRKLHIRKIYTFLIVLTFMYLLFNPIHHEGRILGALHESTINDTETYGLIFAIIGFSCIHWNVWNNVKYTNLMKFFGGVALALSMLSKEPFVFVALPMIIINYAFESKYSSSTRKQHLCMIVAGIGSVFLLLISYLYSNDALACYINIIKQTIIYSKTHAKAHGIFTSGSLLDTLKFDITNLYYGYFGKIRFFTLIPFYLAFFLKWRWSLFTLLNILGFIANMYAVSLGHCFFNHYYIIGCFSFLSIAVYGAACIKDIPNKKILTILNFFAVLLSCWLFCNILSTAWTKGIFTTPGVFQTTYENCTAPVELKTTIDKYTNKDDCILLVSPNFYYYVDLNRRHAFKFAGFIDELIPIYSGTTNEEKLHLIKLDIEKNLPKLIFIENSWLFLRQQKHLNHIVIPLIKEYNYQKIGEGIFVLPSYRLNKPYNINLNFIN